MLLSDIQRDAQQVLYVKKFWILVMNSIRGGVGDFNLTLLTIPPSQAGPGGDLSSLFQKEPVSVCGSSCSSVGSSVVHEERRPLSEELGS